MTCPTCGTTDVSGPFCHHCGAALGGACAQCGASLAAGARFCHVCATPVGSAGRARAMPMWAPWAAAAGVAIALIVAGMILVDGTDQPVATGGTGAGAPAARSGITDISRMSPAERANRLFGRVMLLSERGFTDSVAFFAPMAIAAHGMMGPLDSDARYHLGLIYLAARDPAAARLQADSLLAAVPTHLFGFLLRADAARAANDSAAEARASQAFLANYDAEVALARPEYAGHQVTLEDRHAALSGGS